MGRKREKPLKGGSKTTLYIPQDASVKALEWMNSQDNLSKEILRLIDNHINSKSESISFDDESMRKIVAEEIAKQLQNANTDTNKEEIKKLTKRDKAMKRMKL